MANHFTCSAIDGVAIARSYESGESIASISKCLKVNDRRTRRTLKAQGVVIRSPVNHLPGNHYNRKHSFGREYLDLLYTKEKRSIREITQITGCNNIRYHLVIHAIPLRGFAETRIGKGDNLSPESRARVSLSSTGANNWNWKGGITRADKLFYQGKEWRLLAATCKLRDKLTCRRCHTVYPLHKLRAHHIIHRSEGGPDELGNLATYCNPCHRRIHLGS